MKLTLRNFMSHDHSHVELPVAGVVTVTGANGAGKSALIEGVAAALWGRGLRGARWSPWRPGEEGSVDLSDDELFVRRQWRGDAKSLAWNLGDEQVAFDTTAKAQERLSSVVGPFEVWRRTCVFSSADAAHFTLASDAERKALLEDLLGLGWFDSALATCRRDLRVSRDQLATVRRDVEVAQARLAQVEEQVAQLSEVMDKLPPHQDVGLIKAEVERVSDLVRAAQADLEDAEEIRRQGAREIGELEAEVRQASKRLHQVQDARCHTCGQDIPQSLRDRLLRELRSADERSLAARDEGMKQDEKFASDVREARGELEALRGVASKRRDALRDIEQAQRTRDEMDALRDRIAQETAKLAASISTALVEEQRLRAEVSEIEACEIALGTRGVRAKILGGTLGGIEALANGWLARLASTIEVKLRPYTEKKGGGQTDAISLQLLGAGGDGGYLGASAGERRRVDVAILLALAEVSAAEQGARRWRSPIFFDECFDSLDAEGREAMSELVQGFAKDRLVVLITHDEAVAAMRADMRVRVDAGRIM